MYIMCLIIFEEKAEIQDQHSTLFEPEPGSGSFAEILGQKLDQKQT